MSEILLWAIAVPGVILLQAVLIALLMVWASDEKDD